MTSYAKAAELDLSQEHTLEEVKVGASEFRLHTDAEVRVRVGAPDNPVRVFEAGSSHRFCMRDPSEDFRAIYVTNDPASGVLEVEVEHDFIIRPEPADAAAAYPGQRRLEGDLAPGATIPLGGDALEHVATGRGRTLRVRARVTGTADLTAEADHAPAGMVQPIDVAVAQDDDRLYVAEGQDAGQVQLSVHSLADPGAPVEIGRVSLTGGGTNLADVAALAHDPENAKAVLVGDDGTNAYLVVVDVSDGTAPAQEGDVQLATGKIGPATDVGLVLDPALSAAFVARVNSADTAGGTHGVDYSTPATPVEVNEQSGKARSIAIDTADRRLYVARPPNITVMEYTASAGVGVLNEVDHGLTASFSALALDAGAEVLVAAGVDATGDKVAGLDTSDLALARLWESNHGDGNGFYAVDPEASSLYLASFFGPQLFNYTYDREGLTRVASVNLGGTTTRGCAVHRASNTVYTGKWTDDDVSVVSSAPGADRLVVRPELTDGTPSELGAPAPAVLRDGVAAMVELELEGEEKAEVRVQSRSGNAPTVDYVEVSQQPA